jgi:hypothetical protein
MSVEHRDAAPLPDDNHEKLLATKNELRALWQQLPVAHQATMAMVLVQTVMDGPWGRWLKEALALRWPEEDDPWRKPFPVTRICRNDLKEIQFTEVEIAGLSDQDMARIAREMEDGYLDPTFWSVLEAATKAVLGDRDPPDK